MTRDTLDQMDEETRISNLMMVLQQGRHELLQFGGGHAEFLVLEDPL